MEKKNIPIFKDYNHAYKCIYIHIPKVAGISIEKALFNQKVGHKWALMYKGEDKKLSDIKDFEHFIKSLNDEVFKTNILKWTHFIPQYKYVCDQQGDLIIDFIGKFENIHDDFSCISKILNITTNLTHENKTKHKQEYQKLYTEEMRSIVSSIYKKDFEIFNYDFQIK
ncbi:alpha-2,3-sialyltransferase [hydrothermal vent metagenome]|uniref:Alpha-2,3-sialyltransferase n=1 Tax=hydrothermal vent metagenome TaxID=652676 RepID=A0A1W1ECY3_9ZZZZ